MADARLRRIAFVTRHYRALRYGVDRAIFASCLMVVGALEFLNESFISRPSTWGLAFGLANIFGSAAAWVALWFFTNRQMDRRFGRVRSTNPLRTAWGINIWMFAYFGLSKLDDSYGVGSGLPALKLLLIAAYGLWVCVRLWPVGIHYLLPTTVALVFAFLHADLRDAAAFDGWELRAMFLTMLSWTVAGLIDFGLLLKVLPGRSAEQVDARS